MHPSITIQTTLTIIHLHKLGWKQGKIKVDGKDVTSYEPQAPNLPYGNPTLSTFFNTAQKNQPNPSLDRKNKGKITGDE